MKLVTPEYCRNFRCIADKCSDNCCIGWGIYIDDKTAEYYDSVQGEFGNKLRSSIDHNEQCFINTDSCRCPFLNENNLCDMIISLGEDKLCQICDRHPRYFEWFEDVIEGGIGLSCEEAARLILGADGFSVYEEEAPEKLCCDEDDDEPIDELFCDYLRNARSKIIELLLNKNIPLERSFEMLVSYAEILQEDIDLYDIEAAPDIPDKGKDFDLHMALKILTETEPISGCSMEYLKKLQEMAPEKCAFSPSNENEIRNIAVYFIWRYFMKAVFSGNLYPRLMFSIYSAEIINVMFEHEASKTGSLSFEKKCMLAKNYSKLVEYNEDNLWKIMDNYEI